MWQGPGRGGGAATSQSRKEKPSLHQLHGSWQAIIPLDTRLSVLRETVCHETTTCSILVPSSSNAWTDERATWISCGIDITEGTFMHDEFGRRGGMSRVNCSFIKHGPFIGVQMPAWGEKQHIWTTSNHINAHTCKKKHSPKLSAITATELIDIFYICTLLLI